MKRRYILVLAVILAVAAATAIFARERSAKKKSEETPAGPLALITEPDDGMAPVIDMIRRAARSVDLVIYELDDPQIEAALADDAARGVAVRVILSAGYGGASSTVNRPAYDFLRGHSVPVRWSPGYFSLTHEKALIVDGARALIMTFNLVAKYYATGRDFGIVDGDVRDVAAIEDTFNDDWRGAAHETGMDAARGGNNGDQGDGLLWSPDSEDGLLGLIRSARHSLAIYNEEMADGDVTKALIDAARRGVAVRVVMTGSSQWKWDFAELATAGAAVRTFADDPSAPLYIHAKAIVADSGMPEERAFVGSENFSKASLYNNRELGVVTGDGTVIAGIIKTFAADWRVATPFVVP